MTPQQMQRACEIFERATVCPPAGRRALLLQLCGQDAELLGEVSSLLEHDSQIRDDFLKAPQRGHTRGEDGPPGESKPAGAAGAPALDRALRDPYIGTRVGGFHIRQVIATGGMGTVYEAVQEHPHRTVALKIMRQNIASRSALRRFQFEAQILGRLRHPHIAQVYQAGMHDPGPPPGGQTRAGRDGRTAGERPLSPEAVPFFAMEYIPGARPITQFAREKGLSPADRLELLAKVCDAVHHGHQKGIIHRDLKPANILVDSAGEPKVIDFGVARATDSDLSLTTQQTCISQLVGTIQYMSPEQCDADPHDIDTRSDVYSLGVVLYELLTGELPYQATGLTLYAATRIIKEQTPRRPSSINRRLRGDLETISLKALEKDRDRRYQSAAELARDIQRYLNHEPIAARGPTRWARGVHWIAAHPAVAVIGAGVCLCTLLSLGIMTALQYLPRRLSDEQPAQLEYALDPVADYGNFSPEVKLLTDTGQAIRSWGRESRIWFASLVKLPATLGSGRLLLLGYGFGSPGDFPGALCAFNLERGLSTPMWQRRVETNSVPAELRKYRQATGEQFGVNRGWLLDVFPEERFPQHPGPEIVVAFSRGGFSQSAICIFDLRGELLYQVWHDGIATSCYWMADAQLLVFSGNCHWPYWDASGNLLGKREFDYIVFALRPVPGFVADCYLDYLSSQPGDERLDPVWYLRLLPDSARDLARGAVLYPPFPPRDRQRAVQVDVAMRSYELGAIDIVIDEHGQEIPEGRVYNMGYRRNQNLPDDDPRKIRAPDPNEYRFVPMTLADVLPGSSYLAGPGNEQP